MAIHLPIDIKPRPDQFSADGFHPSEESYAEFGRMAAGRIAVRLNQDTVADTSPGTPCSASTGRPEEICHR